MIPAIFFKPFDDFPTGHSVPLSLKINYVIFILLSIKII
nr:MAG TPA: hypothetical protein [Caudoviricetes sp.]